MMFNKIDREIWLGEGAGAMLSGRILFLEGIVQGDFVLRVSEGIVS